MLKEIKTNYGIFYEVSIPITEELLEIKERCDRDAMRGIAHKALRDNGKDFERFSCYIRFSKFRWDSHPQCACAVYFDYKYKD